MSHDLDITNGVASFADSRVDAKGRVDAWHKLGTPFGERMTAAQALEAAHLANWNVRKHRLWTEGDDGYPIQVTGKVATVRTNPITGMTEQLGVVGKDYTIIQNEDSVGFLDALVDESGAHFEVAGALDGGRRTFTAMLLPDYMEFTGAAGVRDPFNLYITALNSHDGSGSFKVIVTPVRVVCANTECAALSNVASKWAVRHTVNALKSIEEARRSLNLAFRYADAFAEEMNKLIDHTMEEDEARRLIDSVFQVDKAETDQQKTLRTKHADAALEGLYFPTVKGFEKTRYGLYNAVTEYIDHRIVIKDTIGAPAYRSIDGAYADIKSRAFQVLSGAAS
jgi:phage/plasmid-like protein (TIGR03299 family)